MNDDAKPTIAEDRAELLLASIIDLPRDAQAAALSRLIVEQPELREELQARYAMFCRLADLASVRATSPEATAPAPAGLHSFGEYELVRELGRGGMGVVYLARQRRGDQERLVALKVVRDRGSWSTQARERLRREGAAAFRLDHPGICQVFDTGEVEGTPFLTMRYVAGRTLAEHIAASRAGGTTLALPAEVGSDQGSSGTAAGGSGTASRARAIVSLGEQVARALHVAHEAGFVHRDVKPGNIMVALDGQPVLLDFGLVRDEASDHALTITGQSLGTPAYMSPEQIEPRGRRVDRTTDVYSLGVTLYESLALRQPFEGRTREALFRDILTRRPDDLRKVAPFVSRDLQVVIATAMDPDPARRYATALDFAEDLRRARLAQPIVARPPSVVRRLQLWCRRNPLASVVLLLLLVAVGFNVGLARQAQRRAAEAEQARTEAMTDFASAREAVGELVNIAREHLVDVPWLEPVRREIFDRALEFQRSFLARAGSTPELRLETAITKVECSGLLAHFGDPTAGTMLDEALRDLEELAAKGDVEALRWATRGHLTAALLADNRADVAAAESQYRQIGATLDQLAKQRKLTVWERVTCSTAHRSLAKSLQDRGLLDAASEEIETGMQVAPSPSPVFVVERARLLGQRARWRTAKKDHAGAGEDLRVASESLRTLLSGRQQDREACATLAVNLMAQATWFLSGNDADAALRSNTEAKDLLEQLVQTFPMAAILRSNLALVLGTQYQLQRQLGQTPDLEVLRRAVTLMVGVVHDDAENLAQREQLAHCRFRLGQALRKQAFDEARGEYEAALAICEEVLVKKPQDHSARDLAWRTANSLGSLLADGAHYEPARAAFAVARHHGEELLRQSPNGVNARRSQSVLLQNEGMLAAECGDLDSALLRLGEAVALDRGLVAEQASDMRSRVDLLLHLLRRAQIVELRDPPAAAAWRDAEDVVAELSPGGLQRIEGNRGAYFELACIERGFGASLLRTGDLAGAAKALDRAAEGLREVDDNVPCRVELMLLDLAQFERRQAENDRDALAQAQRSLFRHVEAAAQRLNSSRFQCARVRAALPRLEQIAGELLDHDAAASVEKLRQAAGAPR